MVLYPSLVAEIPGVVLEQDLPFLTIEDTTEPQGCAEDAAARIANLELFDVTGVGAPTIKCANDNKINMINDNDEGILSIATIPANNNHDPLILLNTSDSDTLDNKDQNKNNENDDYDSSDNE